MRRKPAVHLELVIGDDELIEPQRGDARDFLERAARLGLGDVLQPRVEVPQDGIFGVPARADDIGDAKFFTICLVRPLEGRVFGVRQTVEAGAVLLGTRVKRQSRHALGLVGEVGMRAYQRQLLSGLGARNRRLDRVEQWIDPGKRTARRGLLGDPRRIFDHVFKYGDEIVEARDIEI